MWLRQCLVSRDFFLTSNTKLPMPDAEGKWLCLSSLSIIEELRLENFKRKEKYLHCALEAGGSRLSSHVSENLEILCCEQYKKNTATQCVSKKKS